MPYPISIFKRTSHHRYPFLFLGSVASLEAKSLGDLTQSDGTLNERAIIFALLRHRSPDFIWDCRNDFVDWHRSLSSNTVLNRYQKPSVYTSKVTTIS